MAPEQQFWTCVLENLRGRFYVGSTDDLERRLTQHNVPDPTGSRYAPKHGPWTLVWSDVHPTGAEAMARKRQIKRMESSRWIRETLLSDTAERVPTRRD